MIVASHQPDLLPYSGFWHKMDRADVFDIAIHDQFQLEGYQRRVKMRGKWAQIRLEKKKTYGPISELRLADGAVALLWDQIRGRYQGSKYWKERSPLLEVWLVDAAVTRDLAGFNLTLIRAMKRWLGIETPLRLAPKQDTAGALRVAERMATYHESDEDRVQYLSGTGALAYMGGKLDVFENRGIEVIWSAHTPVTGDSILTLFFDEKDPMQFIRKAAM